MTVGIFLVNYLLITSVGVFFHYIHKIFKKGILVHILGAVNESIWEHLKLVFWPMLISAVVRVIFRFESTTSNYWFSVGISLIVALLSVPLLYYTVFAFTRREILWVSISLFYVAVFVGLVTEQYIQNLGIGSNILGYAIIVSLISAISWFTFHPPHNFLFIDSITKKYGDPKK